MASIRTQLGAFWILLLGVCVGLAGVMWVLYQNSAGVQVGQARAVTRQVCSNIAARYERSSQADAGDPPQTDLLHVILQLALTETPHVEGGIWSAAGGFIAYAYPTYEGAGTKSDVPEAERAHIAQISRLAAESRSAQTDVLRGTREALILSACPLAVADHDFSAWTMTRVPGEAEVALSHLRMGLGILLAAVLSSGLWLGYLLARGYGHVRRVERALDTPSASIPRLAMTGVHEFDRIVAAINRHSQHLAEAQTQMATLLQKRAHDQRLTALGRMTGGIAHEIRNPIATMRLKAENALAAPATDFHGTLRAILGQIERLDRLVQNLLAIVQPLHLHLAEVRLADWLEERRADHEPRCESREVGLHLETELETAVFDPAHLGRAVDNLVDNAIRHSPSRSTVRLRIFRSPSNRLLLRVSDQGPGVTAEIREHLFEPFATGRVDGTGLGLALVREVALAHGGEVRYLPSGPDAGFEMELPWRES